MPQQLFRARRVALVIVVLAASVAGCQSEHKQTVAGPLIQSPAECTDINFPIYFEPRSAVVTGEAQRLILAALRRSAGCDVTGIVVVGLADAAGAPDANLELSKRRADSVAAIMRRHGFVNVEFRKAAEGDVGAVTRSGDNRPLRRRADVSIHLQPSRP